MALPRPLPGVLVELIAHRLTVFGQPIRIRILDELERSREKNVQQLADDLESTQQNISRHLAILRHAGVVGGRQDGRVVWYTITDPHAFPTVETIGRQLFESPAGTPDKA